MKKALTAGMLCALGLVIVLSSGCAWLRRADRATLAERGYGDVITEEELAALGISPAAPARGMTFAEAANLRTVHFAFDSSDITPDVRRALDANIDILTKQRRVAVMVEGHCDERGTVEYNLALGQRRADSVRRYMVAQGINPDRIFTISYGKEKPADPRSSEEAWAKNRRAEFKIRVR